MCGQKKTELQDKFSAYLQTCFEADVILEPKSLQEDDVRQCFERHTDTWYQPRKQRQKPKRLGSSHKAATGRDNIWNRTGTMNMVGQKTLKIWPRLGRKKRERLMRRRFEEKRGG